jgi:hypothetical protein
MEILKNILNKIQGVKQQPTGEPKPPKVEVHYPRRKRSAQEHKKSQDDFQGLADEEKERQSHGGQSGGDADE